MMFKDAMHEEFGAFPLAYISAGGPELGEIRAVATAVGDGDDTAFYEAWVAAGNRLRQQAEEAERRHRIASARELFLRASGCYGASYHPLYGFPVDPRLREAFRLQMAAFDAALNLFDPPVRPLRIPFGPTTLPAYWIPAAGHEMAKRPLLILTNGYDATVTDLYFGSSVAANRRGYHTLLFDGPGQGELLIEQGIPLRPDWESVVRAVVNFALDLPGVDGERLALSGWSLGGYLALRAASGEPRIKACIADPGLGSIADGLRGFLAKFGVPEEELADFSRIDDALLDQVSAFIDSSRQLRWKIVQRGFWANGATDLRDYLRLIQDFTLEGREHLLQCPTLLTYAEDDPLAARAPAFFETLECPKTLLTFRTGEGAGGHCEMTNRTLLNQRVLDWLDDLWP
ncbi:MAG TPA: alpha/beta fold hydrolase [Chthoniobacteraceae bacterium]|nr:alpha/beta fold hydrolase [Chthoniobacteraceae bacterium]